jgi:hypothetical protein
MKVLSTIFLFLFVSCGFYESNVIDVKDRFFDNKLEFEKLVSTILKNKTLTSQYGHFIKKDEIDKIIKEDLESLNVELNDINKIDCDKFNVTFELIWNNSVHIFLMKEGCRSEYSKSDYIQKGGMIDTYGLGDGWVMWIDHDYI